MKTFMNDVQEIIAELREAKYRLELENNYFRSALKEKDKLIADIRAELKTMDDFALGKNRKKIPDDALF